MKKIVMPLLLLSAAFVTPAYANYFSNPLTGVRLNVGSAPNPTTDDIREHRMPTVAGAAASAPEAGVVASSEKQDTHSIAVGDRENNSTPPSGGTRGVRPASASR
jgi:hypothetical protein